MKKISFVKPEEEIFWNVLQKRVRNYFTENNLSHYANGVMTLKIIVMISGFVIPYFFILFGNIDAHMAFLLCLVMGLAMAGIGFSISHQAAHDAISKNKKVNRALSLTFNLVGMSDYIWKIKHNVYHHAYTNVYELDEALKEGEALRLSPDAPRKKFHRFQHFYVFFVYAFFTVLWAFALDFEKLARYNGNGSRNPAVKHPNKELFIFWTTKVYYVIAAFLLPHYVAGFSWLQVTEGFLAVHIVASLLVTHVLQVEHLVDETQHVRPDENGIIQKSWAVNQLEGTSNFATMTKVFEWYVGGSNYQVEHHLFPGICSIHYPAISKIVEATAKEYGLPYNRKKTFAGAVVSHYRTLKELGKINLSPVQL